MWEKLFQSLRVLKNISQQYYDTTTQIESLRIQERNLLEMMEKCETIEDMITVEERLAQVQSERSKLETAKRYMDTDVAFSYVNITISEVMEYHQDREPVKRNTFVDRLINTIKSTGRGISIIFGRSFVLVDTTDAISNCYFGNLSVFQKENQTISRRKKGRKTSRTGTKGASQTVCNAAVYASRTGSSNVAADDWRRKQSDRYEIKFQLQFLFTTCRFVSSCVLEPVL